MASPRIQLTLSAYQTQGNADTLPQPAESLLADYPLGNISITLWNIPGAEDTLKGNLLNWYNPLWWQKVSILPPVLTGDKLETDQVWKVLSPGILYLCDYQKRIHWKFGERDCLPSHRTTSSLSLASFMCGQLPIVSTDVSSRFTLDQLRMRKHTVEYRNILTNQVNYYHHYRLQWEWNQYLSICRCNSLHQLFPPAVELLNNCTFISSLPQNWILPQSMKYQHYQHFSYHVECLSSNTPGICLKAELPERRSNIHSEFVTGYLPAISHVKIQSILWTN